MDDPFQLLMASCLVDPIIPDAAFFDQVHDDTGYASDNPDVQADMVGMDETAALLADRTDCGYDSELNFDALLLGGYFCHICLPEQDLTCSGGGSCTNVQWSGYICDNEFQIVECIATTGGPGRRSAILATQTGDSSSYCLQNLNGTDVDSETLVLKPGVEYRFQIEVDNDVEICLATVARSDNNVQLVRPLVCGTKTGEQGPIVSIIDDDVLDSSLVVLGPTPTATEFNCIDNPDFKIQIGKRKNKKVVDGCEYIRNQPNARKCRSGRKGKKNRKNCPSSCEEPACTCTDKKTVTYKVGNEKTKIRCNRVNRKLCDLDQKIRKNCPQRCLIPQCVRRL